MSRLGDAMSRPGSKGGNSLSLSRESAPLSLSELPQCSFCSKYSDQVQVVCEGNCLICGRCQSLPATRKLILSFAKKIIDPDLQIPVESSIAPTLNHRIGNNNSDPEPQGGICPLCYKQLARNMRHTIYDFADSIKLDNDGVDNPNVFKEIELDFEENKLHIFYKYFQDYYANNSINEVIWSDNSDELIKKINSMTNQEYLAWLKTDNTMGEICDGLDSDDEDAQNRNKKVEKRKTVIQSDKDAETAKSEKKRQGSIVQHSVGAAAEKDRSAAHAAPSREDKPQALQSQNEVNNRSSQPLNMKSLAPSKFSALVANCFVYLWQLMLRRDHQSMGAVIIRVCTSKTSSQRTNDLRVRAAIHFMSNSISGSSGLTALFSRISSMQPKPLEYTNSPHGALVVSVFAVAYLWDSWYQQHRKSLTDPNLTNTSPIRLRQEFNNFTTLKQVSLRNAIEIVQMLCNVQQTHWVMSSLTASIGENKSKYPWEKLSVSRLIHLITYFYKLENSEVLGSVVIDSAPHSSNSNSSPRKSINRHDLHRHHKNVNLTVPYNLKFNQITERAKKFWNAVVAGSAMFPENSNDVKCPQLQELGHLEKNGTFCMVNFDQALKALDHLSSTGMMYVHDLAFICVAAWDEEHDLIVQNLNKSILASKRRHGVRETFVFEKELSRSDRLILTRLMKVYASEGYAGIDWLDMKARAVRRDFHFSVTPSLLEMPPNELEYHCAKIKESQKMRAQEEMIEDLYETDGPYAPIGWRLSAPGLSRGNMRLSATDLKESEAFEDETSKPITAHEMEAIVRAEFLSSQTLGSKVVEQQTLSKSFIRPSTRDSINTPSRAGTSGSLKAKSDPFASILNASMGTLHSETNQSPPDSPGSRLNRTLSVGLPKSSTINCGFADTNVGVSDNNDNDSFNRSVDADDDNSSLGMTNMIINQSRKDLLDIYNQAESLQLNRQTDIYTPGGMIKDTLSPKMNSDYVANQLYFRQRRALPGAKSGFIPSLTNLGYESPKPSKFQINLADVLTLGSSDALKNTGLLASSKMTKAENANIIGRNKSSSILSGNRTGLATANQAFSHRGDNSHVIQKSYSESALHVAGKVASRGESLGQLSIGFSDNDSVQSRPNTSEEIDEEAKLFAAKSRIRSRLTDALEDSDGLMNSNFALSFDPTENFNKTKKKSTSMVIHDVHVELSELIGNSSRGQNDLFMISERMKHLSLYDATLTEVELKRIFNVNLENGNITGLRVLEFCGVNLGTKLSKVLATKLCQKCDIVDLRFPNNNLGDVGVLKLLDAVVLGGYHDQISNLNISGNQVTFSNPQLNVLSKFNNLKYLDMSRNNISLNTANSHALFFSCMEKLKQIEVLSLAFNSFQDLNFVVLADLIEKSMTQLKVFDMEKTFLTRKSIPLILKLVNLIDPRQVAILKAEREKLPPSELLFALEEAKDRSTFTREISLIDNLFTLDEKIELTQCCRKSFTNLIVNGPPLYLNDYNRYNDIIAGKLWTTNSINEAIEENSDTTKIELESKDTAVMKPPDSEESSMA